MGAACEFVGGIYSDCYGFEVGQSSCGDAFAWLQRVTGLDLAVASELAQLDSLTCEQAATMPLALEWFNGCRTPHNDAMLLSAISGLCLQSSRQDLYRAVLCGVICGIRTIVDNFEVADVPVTNLVVAGGLPSKIACLPQVCSKSTRAV